ncbi:probable serine/threonine-protein kinase pats1 [Amphiura filiformis]|uniref:probable serine/threonine-protein kinase pats1 n=1 Tax=Amphiura filiformis TaxID=82378 RepID=UPI003B20FDAD
MRWQSQEGRELEEIQSSYISGVAESMTSIKGWQPKEEYSPTDIRHEPVTKKKLKEVSPEIVAASHTSQDGSQTPPTPSFFSRATARGFVAPKLEIPEQSSVYVEDESDMSYLDDDINEIPTSIIDELFKEHATEQSLQVRIWDFAGQDLYYTTHQVFLSRKAVYLVVFDLSKDLDQQAEVSMYCVDSGDVKESKLGREYSVCGHHHGFTCLDFLDFWMRSIYTFVIPNKEKDDMEQLSPPIFIIGTHKNDLHNDSQMRDKLVKGKMTTIQDFVAKQCYRKHVVSKYYAVENNLTEDEDVDGEVFRLQNHIKSVIEKEPYMEERIPLRWLLFQKKVQEIARQGKPCISLKEAEKCYCDLPGAPQQVPSSSEMLTMLEYFHDIGQIVYIKNGGEDLKNLVILDPNWLIKIFKEVVCVVDDDSKRAIDIDSWSKLLKHGILDDQLMNYLLKRFLGSSSQDEAHSKKNALLELMKKFDLLCEKETPKGQSCKCYFVPSRLQPSQHHQQVDAVTATSINRPSRTFYVNFHGFLPDGFFHRIVLRAVKWSQEQCDNVEPILMYGRVTFYADNFHECILEMAPPKDARIKASHLYLLL